MARARYSQRGHRGRGFTLVEILIVAALIALFSAIAVINIQQMYEQNLRRAAIAETKQIATALSFADFDIGFFPKLNYLLLPKNDITTTAGDLRADFDYIGYYRQGGLTPPRNIDQLWGGAGYFALPQARTGLFARQGGIIQMRLPSGATGQDSLADSLVPWPTDPWGTPYVVYLLKVTPGLTPEYRFLEDPTEPADFMAAVVSYGPNGVPGALVRDDFTLKNQTTELRQARLFLDGDAVGAGADYTILQPVGYDYDGGPAAARLRLDILSNPNPATYFPGAGPNETVVGILDELTDDIVMNF